MQRLSICKSCEQFTEMGGRPACRLMPCCGAPDTPSPVDFTRRLRADAAKCPHPEGDRWAGTQRETAVIAEMPRGMTEYGLALEVLVQRVRCCKGHADRPACERHRPPWRCGEADVRDKIKRPAFACPDDHWRAVEA